MECVHCRVVSDEVLRVKFYDEEPEMFVSSFLCGDDEGLEL